MPKQGVAKGKGASIVCGFNTLQKTGCLPLAPSLGKDYKESQQAVENPFSTACQVVESRLLYRALGRTIAAAWTPERLAERRRRGGLVEQAQKRYLSAHQPQHEVNRL